MILKEIMLQLESSAHPVAKAIHKGEHFKVLAIAFKKGMILKEHRTNLPAKLTVLNGSVTYMQEGLSKMLEKFDETEIPVGVTHSVICNEGALCLLTQG